MNITLKMTLLTVIGLFWRGIYSLFLNEQASLNENRNFKVAYN